MKEIYNEYFYIPKQGKIQDKVFFARISVFITIIIACLFAMGITAYAYFSHGVTSASNSIIAAYYSLDVTEIANNLTEISSIGEENETDKTTFSIENNKNYEFVLTKSQGENIASTGYCKIVVDNGTEELVYYTQQIGVVNEEVEINSINISIISNTAATVHFIPVWGTYIHHSESDSLNNQLINDDDIINVDFLTQGSSQSEFSNESHDSDDISSLYPPNTATFDEAAPTDFPSYEPDEQENPNTEITAVL